MVDRACRARSPINFGPSRTDDRNLSGLLAAAIASESTQKRRSDVRVPGSYVSDRVLGQ